MTIQLNAEILIEIFSLLPKSDVYTCLFVCRSWFHLAAYSYYRTIQIKNNRKNLTQFRDDLLNSSTPISYFIKHLHVESDPKCKQLTKTSDLFQDILLLCPNLKKLSMPKDVSYWQYLCENPTQIRPTQLSSTGRNRYSNDGYYYKASHQYRKFITELEIHCSCDESIYQTYHSLYDYLANFQGLRHLVIANGSRKHMVYLDKLLRTCANLRSLSFQIDHPFTDAELDDTAYPTLNGLDIFLANFCVSSLQYILRRFVNLNRLTLRVNHNEHEHHVDQFFKSQFVPFIQSLDYVSLQFQINGRSSLEDMINFMNTMHHTARVQFQVHDGRAERTQMNIVRENKLLFLGIQFVRDMAVQHDDMTPYNSYLQTFGPSIEELDITFTTSHKYAEAANLNSILDVSPRIKQLSVHLDQPPTIYFTDSDSVFSLYPVAQLSSTSKHVSELKCLSISCMKISSSFIQALSQCHPHIKKLGFVNCLPELKTQHDKYSYDFTGFKLTSFVFDIFAYRRMCQSNICIILQVGDLKQCYLAQPKEFLAVPEDHLEVEKMCVISLKFQELGQLELQAGKNQSFTKIIKF